MRLSLVEQATLQKITQIATKRKMNLTGLERAQSMTCAAIPGIGNHTIQTVIIVNLRGRGSMVELELPKLATRVRFPSPAPIG